MLFNGIASPDQLKVLTDTLDNYCELEGIEPFTQAHEDAAALVMNLFNSGILVAKDIETALRQRSRRAA